MNILNPFNKVLDATKVYFMSDCHFQHRNLCQGTTVWGDTDNCRKFNTTEDMDNTIINAINHTVPEDCMIINLGDFIFGNKTNIKNFVDKINCQEQHYLFGNHDDWMMDKPEVLSLFTSVHHYLQFFLKFPNGEKIRVCCSHYPITSWNDMNKNSWMIHGHCHQSLHHDNGKIIDVGIDEINNYKPYSSLEIYQFMKDRDVRKVDHH